MEFADGDSEEPLREDVVHHGEGDGDEDEGQVRQGQVDDVTIRRVPLSEPNVCPKITQNNG